jgi:hypothetical protein
MAKQCLLRLHARDKVVARLVGQRVVWLRTLFSPQPGVITTRQALEDLGDRANVPVCAFVEGTSRSSPRISAT